MFGKNPVMKVQPDENTFRVVDVWFTIQGEGPFAGTRAVFVRLHGCNLRCTFCDTEFSNQADPVQTADVLGKRVADLMVEHDCTLVVITGGEPMLWPLHRLMSFVCGHYESRRKRRVLSFQVETAGTVGVYLDQMAQITTEEVCNLHLVVSPKTANLDSKIRQSSYVLAYKYVIGPTTDLDHVTRAPITTNTQNPDAGMVRLAAPPQDVAVYLSPMDSYDPQLNAAAMRQVGHLVKATPGTLAGIQMHKYLRVD
jgi:organic radical activating enzyme